MTFEIPPIPPYGAGAQGVPEPDPPGYIAGQRLAPWWRRMAAASVNWGIMLGYLMLCTAAPGAWWADLLGFVFLAALLTEESPGHLMMSLQMAMPITDSYGKTTLTGPPLRLAYRRSFLKVFDVMLFGWLRPLWDAYRQTTVDSWTGVVFIVVSLDDFSYALNDRSG